MVSDLLTYHVSAHSSNYSQGIVHETKFNVACGEEELCRNQC